MVLLAMFYMPLWKEAHLPIRGERKMSKNKIAIAIAIFLTLSMSASMILVPSANAHTPPWQIPSYALVTAEPSTVGVGQCVLVYAFLGNPPVPSAAIVNTYRRHNYEVIITAPDGTNTTQFYETVEDTTGSQIVTFVPDVAGIYTVTFNYQGQTLGVNDQPPNSQYINDTFLPSTATTTFTVQEEAVPEYPASYPLPVEYWTRPIYGENPYWWTISSNWLGVGSAVNSAVSSGQITGISGESQIQRYPGDAVGSLTSHIMWTKSIQEGGVVGGNNFVIPGDTYFEGSAYSQRYTNPIIVYGMLYYNPPLSFRGSTSGPTYCVDLRTGEEIWVRDDLPTISYAIIWDLQDPNQHGVYPALLITRNFGNVYDAYTGDYLFSVTDVPSGEVMQGLQGEELRLVQINLGNRTDPNYVLAEWNSTKLWDGATFRPGDTGNSPSLHNTDGGSISTPPNPDGNNVVNGSVFDSSDTRYNRYDWNVSIPWRNTMSSSPTILAAFLNDIMICREGRYPSLTGQTLADGSYSTAEYTYFGVDINPDSGTFGQILWENDLSVPNTVTITYGGADPTAGVFVEGIKETRNFNGYSMRDGHKVFGPTPSQTALDYFGNPIYPYVSSQLAYGKLYSLAYGGLLYCYNLTNGDLLWTYGNGGEGNSTDSGFQAPGNYPGLIQAVGNGVIYISVTQHTIETPIFKGAFTRAINATDGTQIWTLSSYTGEFRYVSYAIADGYTNFFNGYDNRIYTLGRGPSALTVSAPNLAAASGQPVVIRGTVTDISSGTQQGEQAARFPNGVPLAADSIMGDWMGYIYQQKPFPENFTGVPVSIDVIDSNDNYRTIGTATTDGSGAFTFTWVPDIPGDYTVIAKFAGTNGYWPSSSETSFTVEEQPAATAPPTPTPASAADLYFVPMSIGSIVAIIVVGLLLFLLLRRR
jgi:outer membrane protein assembly factor BamB